MNLSYDAQLLLYLKKNVLTAFYILKLPLPLPPPPTFTTLQYGSENMAINYRNNEKWGVSCLPKKCDYFMTFLWLKGD